MSKFPCGGIFILWRPRRLPRRNENWQSITAVSSRHQTQWRHDLLPHHHRWRTPVHQPAARWCWASSMQLADSTGQIELEGIPARSHGHWQNPVRSDQPPRVGAGHGCGRGAFGGWKVRFDHTPLSVDCFLIWRKKEWGGCLIYVLLFALEKLGRKSNSGFRLFRANPLKSPLKLTRFFYGEIRIYRLYFSPATFAEYGIYLDSIDYSLDFALQVLYNVSQWEYLWLSLFRRWKRVSYRGGYLPTNQHRIIISLWGRVLPWNDEFEHDDKQKISLRYQV